MGKTRLFFLLTVLVMSVTFTGKGIAEDFITPGEERFRFSGGAFFAGFDTTLRVDNKEFGEGTEINLEDDLNFDDSTTTYYLSGYWRFADRHRLYGGYFSFDRDSSAVLNKDLEVGDETFPVGAGVYSEFNLKVIPISYGYSFINNEKHELTGLIGLQWQKVEFKIDSYGSAGGNQGSIEGTADADAPLPVLGLSYEYRFSKRWTAGLLAEAFYLDLSDDTFAFSGSLVNLAAKTEYWIWNNLGVGAALNYFKLNVDVEDSDWRGELDYEYFGPQVYVVVRF